MNGWQKFRRRKIYFDIIRSHLPLPNMQIVWDLISMQTRFYDHIIRNDKSFQNISKYIHNNPANWQNDNFLK